MVTWYLSPLGPISGEDAGEIIMEARAHWLMMNLKQSPMVPLLQKGLNLTDDHDASPERADASEQPNASERHVVTREQVTQG